MKNRRTAPAELVSITVNCPTLGHVTIVTDRLQFGASCESCEICGTHGKVEVSFTCDCGKYHTIELTFW